jgi:hypothetical protein
MGTFAAHACGDAAGELQSMKPISMLFATAMLMAGTSQSLGIIGDENARATVLTVGQNSCGDWVEARASTSIRHQAFEVKTQAFEGYVVGYLSAANVFNKISEDDLLQEISVSSIWLWFDKDCDQHPLEKLHRAAAALIHELIERAEKK